MFTDHSTIIDDGIEHFGHDRKSGQHARIRSYLQSVERQLEYSSSNQIHSARQCVVAGGEGEDKKVTPQR